jgi:pimeloyl-ACP methyl ester carboxylesterase
MSRTRRGILHYEHHFPRLSDTRTTLVLLHEIGLDMTCWDAIIPELSELYHVIRFDLRGHGYNRTTADEQLSWELLCEDFEYLMTHLQLQNAHLIGHGIGANIAVKVAIRQPSLVLSLTLLSVPGYLPKGLVQQTLQHRSSLLTSTSREQFAKSMVQSITVLPIDSLEVQKLIKAYSSMDASTYLSFLELFMGSDMVPDFQALQHPTLVLAGEFDTWYTPPLSAITASYLAHSRFLVVPGAGNTMFLDRPDITAQCILNHIEKRKNFLAPLTKPAHPATELIRKRVLEMTQSGSCDMQAGSHLAVQAFDTFLVYVNEIEINKGWTEHFTKSLLIYLILHPQSTRQEVGEALWPTLPFSQSEGELHKSLFRLKKLLELQPYSSEQELITVDQQGITLRGHIHCDLLQLTESIQQAANETAENIKEQLIMDLIDQLPSTAMAQFNEPWLLRLREELSAQLEELIQWLADRLSQRGKHPTALKYLQKIPSYSDLS